MTNPRRLKYTINEVKNTFSKVSLTPDFKVTFADFPNDFTQASYTLKNHLTDAGLLGSIDDEFSFIEKLELLCNATNLPGSAFDVSQITGDRQGQMEIFPTMRDYGRQISLTFYVDSKHKVIRFFEEWMNYISPVITSRGLVNSTNRGQNLSKNPTMSNGVVRMRYPKTYRTNFLITKFEKDVGYRTQLSDYLTYEFIDAFPMNITPMKVAYGTSDKLTITVTMAYQRYITRNNPSTILSA